MLAFEKFLESMDLSTPVGAGLTPPQTSPHTIASSGGWGAPQKQPTQQRQAPQNQVPSPQTKPNQQQPNQQQQQQPNQQQQQQPQLKASPLNPEEKKQIVSLLGDYIKELDYDLQNGQVTFKLKSGDQVFSANSAMESAQAALNYFQQREQDFLSGFKNQLGPEMLGKLQELEKQGQALIQKDLQRYPGTIMIAIGKKGFAVPLEDNPIQKAVTFVQRALSPNESFRNYVPGGFPGEFLTSSARLKPADS